MGDRKKNLTSFEKDLDNPDTFYRRGIVNNKTPHFQVNNKILNLRKMTDVLMNPYNRVENSGNLLYEERWNMGFLFVYDLTRPELTFRKILMAIKCVLKAQKEQQKK